MRFAEGGVVRDVLQEIRGDLAARRMYDKYSAATMIEPSIFVANLDLMAAHLRPAWLPGVIVECGTWRGGMAAAMIETCGLDREYWFFDSFQGLPQAQSVDGPAARAYQEDTGSERYHDNCRATAAECRATLDKSGCDWRRAKLFEGPIEDQIVEPAPIAVLRLDVDWYRGTTICLNKFWDQVVPGGLIIIDDYYVWDGCSRAVHDFLSVRRATERIEKREGVAYMIRRAD